MGPLATRFLHDTEVLGVFTLIDLYGVQDRVRFRPDDSLDEKARRVHEWLAGLFHHERKTTAFFPHLAVHETEAWLLAEV